MIFTGRRDYIDSLGSLLLYMRNPNTNYEHLQQLDHMVLNFYYFNANSYSAIPIDFN